MFLISLVLDSDCDDIAATAKKGWTCGEEKTLPKSPKSNMILEGRHFKENNLCSLVGSGNNMWKGRAFVLLDEFLFLGVIFLLLVTEAAVGSGHLCDNNDSFCPTLMTWTVLCSTMPTYRKTQ